MILHIKDIIILFKNTGDKNYEGHKSIKIYQGTDRRIST